ncbi:MAG: hypothetical protein NC489_44765 [Ruminococcus flavefaciens]|nr:hypothetical protein [Ruminococcus flavefaciens]
MKTRKEVIHVKADKLAAFTARVADDHSRPTVFRDRRRAARMDRGRWKNDLKKGLYD